MEQEFQGKYGGEGSPQLHSRSYVLMILIPDGITSVFIMSMYMCYMYQRYRTYQAYLNKKMYDKATKTKL